MSVLSRLSRGLLVLAIGCSLSGCANYFMITTEYVAADTPIPPPEVLKTREYSSHAKQVRVLAIQAPDRCINEGASTRSGKQRQNASVMQTTCGVHLADIERGLVRSGYQVVSWKEMWLTQKQDGVSPRDAAIKLKADAIFLVNSLDRSSVSQGENARWERRFYKSSSAGETQDAASVNEVLKKQFIKRIRKQERILAGTQRLSATINATMIMTRTGRSVWFYEWTASEEKQAALKGEVLVACDAELCTQAARGGTGRRGKLSSGDTEAISTQGRSADVKRTIHDRLMKQVIRDLVGRFAAG